MNPELAAAVRKAKGISGPHRQIEKPWPNQRFAVTHPRWAPYAGKLHVRSCAGGAQ